MMPGMARFEDLQHSFWDTGIDHGVQPPLTDLAVSEAEQALDVRLPGPLLDLLRMQNGGQIAGELECLSHDPADLMEC